MRLAESIGSKEKKGIQLLVNNGKLADEHLLQRLTPLAGIARDDNTKYSGGAPDFESAESVSSHLLRSEPSQWLDTFQTNVVAQYFTTAAFLPLLQIGSSAIPGYSSSVVNIASISGVMKGSSNGQFAYASSKAGTLSQSHLIFQPIYHISVHPPDSHDGFDVCKHTNPCELYSARYFSERDDHWDIRR